MNKLFLILLFVSPTTCFAKSFPSPTAARQYTEAVMSTVASGKIEEGLQMIKPYSSISTAEFDAMIAQAKIQVPIISQRYGKSIGQEFIKEERVGESLMSLAYIQKFEEHAVIWAFILYKGSKGWQINTFRFDDEIKQLFQ